MTAEMMLGPRHMLVGILERLACRVNQVQPGARRRRLLFLGERQGSESENEPDRQHAGDDRALLQHALLPLVTTNSRASAGGAPAPRRPAARTPLIAAPRPAGPQPRDGLQRGLPLTLLR